MAQSIKQIFDNSDKADQIDPNRVKDPITQRKLRDDAKLEQARKGKLSTQKYSDRIER